MRSELLDPVNNVESVTHVTGLKCYLSGRSYKIPKDRAELKSIGRTLFAGQEKDVKPFDTFVPVPETTGDFDQMPMLAGQGVGLVQKIEPVHDVITNLMHDAAEVAAGFAVATTTTP